MAYYKILDRKGHELQKFIKLSDVVEGDTSSEKQVLDYVDERFNQVELWSTSQAFRDEKIRDVEIEDLKEIVN